MQNHAMHSRPDRRLRFIVIGAVAALAIIIGALTAQTSLRVGLILIAGEGLLISLPYAGPNLLLVILALTWWLPKDLNLLFLGNYGVYLTLPEMVTYFGLVLLPVSGLRKNSIGRQSIWFDPVWLCFISLLLGGLIASTNIRTPAGYAMLRRSTVYFVSVVILCRYLLKRQGQVCRILRLMLVSDCAFIAFILIAPRLPGTLFENAPSYLNTSRLGGVYTIPHVGALYFGPNTIGLVTGMTAVMALTFALFGRALSGRVVAGLVFLLNVVVLAMTGSRGSWASTLLALIPVAILALPTNSVAKAIPYAVALIAGLIFLLPRISSTELVGRWQSMTLLANDPYGSGQQRLDLLATGLGLFWRNPFGIGYGTFVTLTDNFVLWEQNLLLNTLLGGGFLGLTGLMGFFVILFGRGASKLISERKKTTNYVCLACLGASLAFFFNSLVTDPNISEGVYFAWLVLGITFASISVPAPAASYSGSQNA
jgi:hypothetical protein